MLSQRSARNARNTGGAFGIPTFIRAQPRLHGIEGVVRF